jgi:hypothetical protein
MTSSDNPEEKPNAGNVDWIGVVLSAFANKARANYPLTPALREG